MSVNAATIDSIRLLVARSRGIRLADFFTRAFGCWHLNMARPISGADETYRTCLDCGARRRFDTQTWMMHGPYYFK
jgi:hypothetical protein